MKSLRALGYISVAQLPRARGPQLDAQRDRIRRACEQRGWELLEVISEIELAERGGAGRPALEYALRRLQDGAAARLVVARLDRLCRSIADLEVIFDQVEGSGAQLLCVEPEIDTGAEAGRTVMRALVMVGVRERERLAQRTRKGLMTARGRRAELRPAVADRPELERRILALHEQGLTMQAIADTLNAEGVPTLRGGARWRPSSVHTTVVHKQREA